jgi:hypothetical protein
LGEQSAIGLLPMALQSIDEPLRPVFEPRDLVQIEIKLNSSFHRFLLLHPIKLLQISGIPPH